MKIFRVSVVIAISDMKNALVGEGVEVVTPTDWNSVKRSLDLVRQGSLDLVRQGSLDLVREGRTHDRG